MSASRRPFGHGFLGIIFIPKTKHMRVRMDMCIHPYPCVRTRARYTAPRPLAPSLTLIHT